MKLQLKVDNQRFNSQHENESIEPSNLPTVIEINEAIKWLDEQVKLHPEWINDSIPKHIWHMQNLIDADKVIKNNERERAVTLFTDWLVKASYRGFPVLGNDLDSIRNMIMKD